jgi:membrane protein implicated in regulation of membrane protease activity
MQDWMIWAAVAGIVVIFELFTGTFYLLMMALGLIAGSVSAAAGLGSALQLIVAAAVGAAATMRLHRSKYGKRHAVNPAHDPDINLDIGRSIAVDAWQLPADGPCRARVMYRGAPWDVELQPGASCVPGVFRICEIRGSRLIVAPQ